MGIDGADIKRRNEKREKIDTSPINLIGTSCLVVGTIALYNGLSGFFYIAMSTGILCFISSYRMNNKKISKHNITFSADMTSEEEQTTEKSSEKNWEEIFAAIDRLFNKYVDLIAALVFIARADGQMRESERDIIIDICLELSDYKEIPRYKLEFILKDMRTSGIDFKGLIDKIVNVNSGWIKILNEGAEKIINTQKTISPGEQFCLDRLKEYSNSEDS
ncbi:MAG: hypothetical protein ACOYB1_18500 [Limnohabitans sp.]